MTVFTLPGGIVHFDLNKLIKLLQLFELVLVGAWTRYHCKVTPVCMAVEQLGHFLSGNLYKVAEAPVKEIRNEQHGSSWVIWIFFWKEICQYNSPASYMSTWSKPGSKWDSVCLSFFVRKFLLKLRNLTETSRSSLVSSHNFSSWINLLWLKEKNGVIK